VVPDLIDILHGGSRFLRVVPDLIYYIVFQGGSRFNRYTNGSWSFRVVPDLIGILHSVSGWFQIQ
jgi:hypothetical protein